MALTSEWRHSMPLIHLDIKLPIDFFESEDGVLAVEVISVSISPESRDPTAAARLATALRSQYGITAIPHRQGAHDYGPDVVCFGPQVVRCSFHVPMARQGICRKRMPCIVRQVNVDDIKAAAASRRIALDGIIHRVLQEFLDVELIMIADAVIATDLVKKASTFGR